MYLLNIVRFRNIGPALRAQDRGIPTSYHIISYHTTINDIYSFVNFVLFSYVISFLFLIILVISNYVIT